MYVYFDENLSFVRKLFNEWFFFLEFKLYKNSKLNEFVLYTKTSEIGSVFIVGVFETKNYIQLNSLPIRGMYIVKICELEWLEEAHRGPL